MKKSNYTLKIDTPCKQNWNLMTEEDLGRFCSKCSKTVVDLTRMNDHEIIRQLSNSKNSPCVRLTKNQSEILIKSNPKVQPKFYKILAGMLLLGSSNYISAQKSPILNTEFKTYPVNTVLPTFQEDVSKLDSLKHTFSGKVLDINTHEPIPFVSILIKGTKNNVETNFDGEFILEIPDSLLEQEVILLISAIDHEDLEYSFNSSQLPLTKSFYLSPNEIFIIGAVEMKKEQVEEYKWWRFWK